MLRSFATMGDKMPHVRWFDEIGAQELASVGGKNAALGELYQHLGAHGAPVPNGFALTTRA